VKVAVDYTEPLPEVIATRYWMEHDLWPSVSALAKVCGFDAVGKPSFDRWFRREVARWQHTARAVSPCLRHPDRDMGTRGRDCPMCARAYCAHWCLESSLGRPIPERIAAHEVANAERGVVSNAKLRYTSEWGDAAVQSMEDRLWTCRHLLPGYAVGMPMRHFDCTALTDDATACHNTPAPDTRRTTPNMEAALG
jgi:hypothetical protein